MSRISLLPENELKPIAIALSEQLEKIRFESPALNQDLATARNDLLLDRVSPSLYCKNDAVTQAMHILNTQNQYFLLGLFQIWQKQPHTFSTFQKSLLAASAVILFAAAILSHEIFVILLNGKPKLKATGGAIADYCTTGLSDKVVAICADLNEGVTAVFNMNDPSRTLPSYTGQVNDTINGPVPTTALQTIPSWFIPSGWIDFFTCTRENNSTEMVGHAYFGTAQAAIEKASNGFPVASTVIDGNPNPIISYVELTILIPMFLAGFCIKIQEGGYSTFTNPAGQDYGHFNGYERGATAFEQSAYAFAGTYGGIAGVALLTAIYLLSKKACEKWDSSQEARKGFTAGREANRLFKTLCKKVEETTTPVVTVCA
ncbi:MAG: hypothetical protein Q8L78_07410 [Coxiellaceae bacterium]|nr:hypothetical protein [Coxiellaceae bacterium]